MEERGLVVESPTRFFAGNAQKKIEECRFFIFLTFKINTFVEIIFVDR
jgi:hypothetical protein